MCGQGGGEGATYKHSNLNSNTCMDEWILPPFSQDQVGQILYNVKYMYMYRLKFTYLRHQTGLNQMLK